MRIIDLEHWDRREHYKMFSAQTFPFFGVTFPLDVTRLYDYTKRNHISFYYSLAYLTAKAMEPIENFHYRIRGGQVVCVDELIPSFTDLHTGSELFHIVSLPAGDDLPAFCRKAKEVSERQTTLLSGEDRDEYIFISCLPWFDLTGAMNDRNLDPDDSFPRVVWGKYTEQDGRKMLHYSIEVNHRLMDGLHIGKFYQNLCGLIAAL